MNRKVVLSLVLAAAGIAVTIAPAFAGSANVNFLAKAQVNANCTISKLTDLDFGTYDPLSANAAADLPGSAGVLQIACTRGSTGVTIGLDVGQNASGTQRNMKTGAGGANQLLAYNLYQDAGLTTAWNNTSTFAVGAALIDRLPHTITVYGNVPQAQDVTTGSYTDTVKATINF